MGWLYVRGEMDMTHIRAGSQMDTTHIWTHTAHARAAACQHTIRANQLHQLISGLVPTKNWSLKFSVLFQIAPYVRRA